MEQIEFPLLIGIKDASIKLGVSEDWLYRNWQNLPFAFKMGKSIKFSLQGMSEWIKEKQDARQGLQEGKGFLD